MKKIRTDVSMTIGLFCLSAGVMATTVYGPDGGLEITQLGQIYWVRDLKGGPTYTVLPLPKGLMILNPNASATIVPFNADDDLPESHVQEPVVTPSQDDVSM